MKTTITKFVATVLFWTFAIGMSWVCVYMALKGIQRVWALLIIALLCGCTAPVKPVPPVINLPYPALGAADKFAFVP